MTGGLEEEASPFSPAHCVSVLRGHWLGPCTRPHPHRTRAHRGSALDCPFSIPRLQPAWLRNAVCGGDQPDFHLVFHCVPRAALWWFVPTPLTQVKHQALGAVNVTRCPHLQWPLRPRLLPEGFAASQWYLWYTNPSGKASGASEGSSGHALPPFPSTDRAVPKLGAENSLHHITPWAAFSQFSVPRVLMRASLTGWVNPKA